MSRSKTVCLTTFKEEFDSKIRFYQTTGFGIVGAGTDVILISSDETAQMLCSADGKRLRAFDFPEN